MPSHSYSEECGDVPADALVDMFTEYFKKLNSVEQKEIIKELILIRFSMVKERFQLTSTTMLNCRVDVPCWLCAKCPDKCAQYKAVFKAGQ